MQKILEYKGFIGSVDISLEDNILYGKILYINGLITYEASTPDELKAEFESAVDDYIRFCQEQGLDASKSFNGKFNVRISPEIHKKASLLATKQGVSLNAFVSKSIENEIAANSREVPIVYEYMSREIIEFTRKFNINDFSTENLELRRRPLHINAKVGRYVS